jgi:glycosyltransferase involved in cell wall biosynthesis
MDWRAWDKCGFSCRETNKVVRVNKKAAKKATVILANSEWTNGLIRKFYDVDDAVVINPPVPFSQPVGLGLGKRIIFVGNGERKGQGMFRRIASKMPEHENRFLIVANKRVNTGVVLYSGWIGNDGSLAAIYRDAELLVCCDQEPPAFNRIPREASHFGVPVVASNCGGLPESVNGGGVLVDDYRNPSAFVDAIKRLLGNKVEYAKCQSEQLKTATTADTSSQFLKVVLSVIEKN